MFFSCFILFYFDVVTSCGNASTGRHRCLPSTLHLRLCTSLDGFFCFWEPSPSLTPRPSNTRATSARLYTRTYLRWVSQGFPRGCRKYSLKWISTTRLIENVSRTPSEASRTERGSMPRP